MQKDCSYQQRGSKRMSTEANVKKRIDLTHKHCNPSNTTHKS